MKVPNTNYTPVMAKLAEEWFENLEDQTIKAMVHILLVEATHCQKPVENGEAICKCKLDCHLHDWRAK